MRQMLDASTGANNTYHKKIEHGDIFYHIPSIDE